MAATKTNEIVKIKLADGASMPEQAHSQDVGYDVKSISCEYDEEHDMYIYHTGIYVETEEEKGYNKAIYLFPRSSNSKKECYLTNSVGIVDSDIYRGEVQVRFKNRTSLNVLIEIEALKRVIDNMGNNGFPLRYNDVIGVVRREYINRAKRLEFAPYNVGDRCAQMVFSAEQKVVFELAEELNNDTDRGSDGFGKSGK